MRPIQHALSAPAAALLGLIFAACGGSTFTAQADGSVEPDAAEPDAKEPGDAATEHALDATPDLPWQEAAVEASATDAACTTGALAACYTGPPGTKGVGPCVEGQKECKPDGTWTPCYGEVTPAPEKCDGEDNDCDGVYDDGPWTINPPGVACNKQCLETSGDPDCDGLKNAQDPWTTCNTLVFADEFKSIASSWLQSGNVVSTCGEAVFGETGTLRLSGSLTLATPTYLAETRVKLGKNVAAPAWSVGISTVDDGGNQRRTCEIWLSKANGQMEPGTHMFLGSNAGSAGAWDPKYSFPAAEGQTYILQSFGTASEHRCRLISADTLTVLKELFVPAGSITLTGAASVTVYTKARSASFDYVRVFSTP